MARRKKFGRAKRRHHTPGKMNKGESRYAEYLNIKRMAGEIIEFAFEPVALRLADRTTYTPDFRVVLPDGTIEYHEVKPKSGNKFYSAEKGWLKLKISAEQHPYHFFVVWPTDKTHTKWNIQEINPEKE